MESLSVSRVLWITVAEVSLRLWSRDAQVLKASQGFQMLYPLNTSSLEGKARETET